MYTYNDLLDDVRKIGIEDSDNLMVHSSMKAIGDVERGADTVIDVLMDSVKSGMLVLPTHTWATIKDNCIFDKDAEPACVGILPNIFMKRAGVVRSFHPTHSVAAYGKDACNFIAGEERQTTPCSRTGCYGRFYDMNGKILLIGCGLNRNTYMHGVEEWFGVNNRLTKEASPLTIKISDRVEQKVYMHRHFKPDGISISEYYVKMEKPFIERGIIKKCKIGDAECMIMNAREVADAMTQLLEGDSDMFSNYEPIKLSKL